MIRYDRGFSLTRFATMVALIVVGGVSVSTHNGFVIPARSFAGAITIDGSVAGDAAAWGTGSNAAPSPNTCEEFTLGTGSPLTVFGARDATDFYVAFRIPDNSPSTAPFPLDRLVMFFDSNHAGGAALQADDVAYDFPFGPATAPMANQRKFTGTSPTWTLAGGAFPAGIQAAYTRSAAEIVFEVKIPTTEITAPANAAVGFSFVFLNQTTLECSPGELTTFKVVWPPSLTFPAGAITLPDANNNPSLWGDLGKDLGKVTFRTPVCCDNQDIQFVGLAGTSFLGDSDVPIIALVHPENTFASTNVNVQIKVHKFGTGGMDIFNGTQPPPFGVPGTGSAPPIGIPSAPGTWHTPNETFHACIEALILAPTNPDDYTIGTNGVAQRNANVTAVKKAMLSRLEFVTFNPDKAEARTIKLLSVQRGPRIDGLTFQLAQPDGPVGPQQEVNVALIANVGANVPNTDLPQRRIHVPAATGRENSVSVDVRAGDQIHFTATGDVDIDGDGRAPSAGPGGADMSNVFGDEEAFLISGRAGRRVGGALVGSFDGFESTFFIGAAATITVPQNAQSLRLAINDLVDRQRDNTGDGFDVVGWTLTAALPNPEPGVAAAALAEPLFPQVHIAAAAYQPVTMAGIAGNYNVVTNLGGVIQQILITDADATTPPFWQKYGLWLILLIILIIAVLLLRRKRKTA